MRRKDKEFEALINTIPQIAWMSMPDGRAYWWNERWFEYIGTTQEEMEVKGWESIPDPKLVPEISKRWKKAIETGEPFEQMIRLRGRDGQYKWFMTRALPVRSEEGVITRWVGTSTDVDEQTTFQRQLTDTLESMTDTFLAIDKDWKIQQVNAVLLRETGFRRDQLIGRDFREVFLSTPELQKSKYWTEYHRLMRDRVAVTFEEHYEPLDMFTSTRAYPTSEGGFTIFSVDITEQKRSEKAMQAAKEEAERANMLKSAFLANMSHEIRTPLGAMLGFADLLREPGLAEEERKAYLDILIRNGEQLSFIINDILDLSKVEAGHLTLEFLPTHPDSIATDVVSLLRMKAKEKGLKLEYLSDVTTPKDVTADPSRVRQVLLNLVNNAVKFTEKGRVTIHSSSHIAESGRRFVEFTITDTGMGIAEDQRERIFGMFVQADGSMTRRFGGTGLGLPLSRSLARALGGEVVVVKSELGRGSTFSFTFEDRPEKRSREEERVESALSSASEMVVGALPLEGTKVLVVDDSPDNQKLISRFLTKAGASVDSAVNGLEGCERALANDYDLVLMDIQMPVMDGYTAAHRLRDRGYGKPIIALTAHALNEVRKRALSVGCTDHLSKPISAKELISTVAKYSHPHDLGITH